jgi:hypothetical protein
MTLLADSILIGMPISNIIKLQLPKVQRFALVFVFSLGAFVMVTTIIRLVSLSPLQTQGDLLCEPSLRLLPLLRAHSLIVTQGINVAPTAGP